MTFPVWEAESVAKNGAGSGGRQRAYDQIRQAIVEGRYQAGQRLVEQRLGEEFNVSRTPVREALRMLESEGLVLSLPNKGSVVRPLTVKDIYDIYELRARLESLAAERAARNPSPKQVAVLQSANEEFAAIVPTFTNDDLEGLRRMNTANRHFHDGLLDMADSWRLTQLLARTVHAVLVFQGFQSYDHPELERSLLFHRLIADAVARSEPERAGNLIAEHIMLARDSLLAKRAAQNEVALDSMEADP